MNEADIDRMKNAERQRRWRERHQSCPGLVRANEERQQGCALLREQQVPLEVAKRRPVARQALLEFIERERLELAIAGWGQVEPGVWAWKEIE